MRQEQNQTIKRVLYSPSEFAGACGRHPTWTYRLLYSNKIQAVTELGRILIPASELERLLSLARPYNPIPRRKRQPTPAAVEEEAEPNEIIRIEQDGAGRAPIFSKLPNVGFREFLASQRENENDKGARTTKSETPSGKDGAPKC